jgi:hypothetical protein
VLIRRDTQVIYELLKVARKKDKDSTTGYSQVNFAEKGVKSTSMKSKGSKPTKEMTKEEEMWRDAHNFASSVSDSRFVSQLKATPVDMCLRDAITGAEKSAYNYLRRLIESLVDAIGQNIFTIQKAERDEQIQREVSSDEDKELGILRSEFVHQIEDLTRERSRSYVHTQPRVMAHGLTQRSPKIIHVDHFAAKKERYYYPGLLVHPFNRERTLLAG